MNIIKAVGRIQYLEAEVRRLEHALAALRQPPALTVREREVLARLIEGNSDKEIAARLRMGMGTVKSHMRHLAQKFKTTNRTATVVAAIRAGFTPDAAMKGKTP